MAWHSPPPRHLSGLGFQWGADSSEHTTVFILHTHTHPPASSHPHLVAGPLLRETCPCTLLCTTMDHQVGGPDCFQARAWMSWP